MRFLVTGGREYQNWNAVVHALRQMPADATLVHGCAPGADSLAAEWWEDIQERPTDPHPADWNGPCRESCRPGHRRPRGDTTICPAAGVYRNRAAGVRVLEVCRESSE